MAAMDSRIGTRTRHGVRYRVGASRPAITSVPLASSHPAAPNDASDPPQPAPAMVLRMLSSRNLLTSSPLLAVPNSG